MSEYAFNNVSSVAAIALAAGYSVDLRSTDEDTDEEGIICTTHTYHVWSPHQKKTRVQSVLDSDSTPNVLEDPEDYCIPDSSAAGRLIRQVELKLWHRTRTWTGKCTCLEDVAKGFQCRHETCVMLKISGIGADYSVSIDMFNPLFRTCFQACRPVAMSDHKLAKTMKERTSLCATSASRLLHSAQVNYHACMSEARKVALKIQEDPDECAKCSVWKHFKGCVGVAIYVYVHAYIYTSIYLLSISIYIYISIYLYIYISIYLYIYVSLYLYVIAWMYL